MDKLSSSDYQRILAVLRRDASLRCREQERIRRLRGAVEEDEEEEEAEADRKALALARERRLNARACVRCRRGFPRSGAILRCGRCRFRICGDCCVQSDSSAPGACFCIPCYREVQLKSGDWFYSQLRKRFGAFGVQLEEGTFLHRNSNKALAEEVDSETAKVREFVEKLVEAIVSGGLDNVNINRLYSHPEYDCMFSKYHSSLCDAIARLTIALQMSISHQPLPANLDQLGKAEKDGLVAMVGEEDDDGLLCSPSVAHAQLKTLVQQAIDEARELPRLGVQQFVSNGYKKLQPDEGDVEMENNPLENDVQDVSEDFSSKTYEDILATAILNKVILQCQKENEWGPLKEVGNVDRNRNLLVDRVEVGVQAEVEVPCRMRGDGCGPEGASAGEYAEDDDEDVNDNANFNSFGRWRNRSQPISYRIEKKVEEVMTTYSSEDEENFGGLSHEGDLVAIDRDHPISSGSSLDEDTSLSMMRGLALHRRTAPFPEFGVDIVDVDDDGDNECSGDEAGYVEESLKNSSTTIISGVDSWEENWLFQRRRLKLRGTLSNGRYPLVPMLVPNPSEDLHAQIGDVDAEEISDLSECNESTEWDFNEEFTRSHHLSSSSASVVSDSLSSEPLSDPLLSSVPGTIDECSIEAKNHGLLDFAETHSHQQDSEYTEDYAAAEQRRLAMTPSPLPQERNNGLDAAAETLIAPKPVPRPRTQIPTISRTASSPQKYIPPDNRQLPPPASKMELLQAPESAVIYSGKAAHFVLGLWSHFPADVWWFHEELLLEEDDNHRIFATYQESSRPSMLYHLEIFNTDPQNSSGNYSVVAADLFGNSIWQDFTLTVRSSRRTDFYPEFVVEPTDVTVAEGSEVELLLEVKGHPEPKVSFWKGASLIHYSPNGYVIERQGGGHWTLRINKIAPIDGGKFVVEARNRVGVTTATAEVQVVELDSASPPEEAIVPNIEEEMRALSTLEESSSVLQNGLQYQAEELRSSARKLSQLISQLEDLEIHLHSMEAEFGSLHSDLDFGGIDMTTYVSSPWSTPLSSVSSSPPSSLSTSSSQAISALEDSSLEQRKAHLQELLSCLQKEVEEAEGSRDELSECSPRKDIHSHDEQAAPPRPGTIAEREHRKWASAPPMPDNPYSPEKISERLRSINLKRSLGTSRGSGSDTSIDFPEFQSESENSEIAIPKVTINCGGKYLNPKKYSRDYYINSASDSGRDELCRSNDRIEERRLPNMDQQSDIDKQEEDLNGRKKEFIVDTEVARLKKNINKTENKQTQSTEAVISQSSPYSGSEQKNNEVKSLTENDEVIQETTEHSPPGKDNSGRNSTDELCLTNLQNEVPSLTEVPLTSGLINGSHSLELIEPSENVYECNLKLSSKEPSSNCKEEKIVTDMSRLLSPEPKSPPLQVAEDMPSLPSVRQLARQFSAAAKGEENDTAPIPRRRKVPKEVVIIKKTEGLEARIDPPLQVEKNEGIMDAELASSPCSMGTWNNTGVGDTNSCFSPLHLHSNSNALPLELHQPSQHSSEIKLNNKSKILDNQTKSTKYQSTLHSKISATTAVNIVSGFNSISGNAHPNVSSITTNCKAFDFKDVDVIHSESYKVDIQDSQEHGSSNMHGLHFENSADAAMKHHPCNLCLHHQKVQLKNAQKSPLYNPQLLMQFPADCALPHKPGLSQVSVSPHCCSFSPETVELPLGTGGCAPEQEESPEGDTSLSSPSACVSMIKLSNLDKKIDDHESQEISLSRYDNDYTLFGKKLLKNDEQAGDENVPMAQQLKTQGPCSTEEKSTCYPLPTDYILKVNECQEGKNSAKGDVIENRMPKECDNYSQDMTDSGCHQKMDTQNGEVKHNVNWKGICYLIEARLGAREACGKTSYDEDSSYGRRRKIYPVHSLTARSISREFREGLRQSQQMPLGKPVTNPNEKSLMWRNANGDQRQNVVTMDQTKVESTLHQCYATLDNPLCETQNDENPKALNGTELHEGTPSVESAMDETDGQFLRNVEGSIAFWERLNPQGASSNGHPNMSDSNSIPSLE